MVTDKEKSRKFSSMTIDDVVETFGIEVDYTGEGLEFWLDLPQQTSAQENESLESLRKILISNVANWNEFELEILFISPLINMVNFYEVNVKPFIERTIAAEVDSIAMHGEVDWIISKGFGRPKAPFFCLKEFKKAKNSSNDPEGQLLTAMLIAQAQNQDNKPIYGGYLFGSLWNFATLLDNQYCVSREFNATRRDDLLHIIYILRKIKEIVLNR